MASLGRTARRKRGRVDGIMRRKTQDAVDDLGAMVREHGAAVMVHVFYSSADFAGKRALAAKLARMWARALQDGERVVVAHGGGTFIGQQSRWPIHRDDDRRVLALANLAAYL